MRKACKPWDVHYRVAYKRPDQKEWQWVNCEDFETFKEAKMHLGLMVFAYTVDLCVVKCQSVAFLQGRIKHFK